MHFMCTEWSTGVTEIRKYEKHAFKVQKYIKLTSYCGGCIGDEGVGVLVQKILRYTYSLVDGSYGYSRSEY